MPLLPAHRTKARGSAFCNLLLKEDWRADLKARTLVTDSAWNWSARMWSADILTLRESHKEWRNAGILTGTSGLSPKFADKVFPVGAAVQQPRQGRKIVAQGVSPGRRSPHPAFGTPLPRGRERGRGRGRARKPTAGAVGCGLPPASRADFIDEPMT